MMPVKQAGRRGFGRTFRRTALCAATVCLGLGHAGAVRCADALPADLPAELFHAEAPVDDSDASGSAFLPTDRAKERHLDRARRLCEAGQWTDAAGALDELLAETGDAFTTDTGPGGSRESVRARATRLVDSLPPPGRDAYQLLCRASAERALAEAVARDDGDAVAAVARRWFATPAGRRAAVIATVIALENGAAPAAIGWIDRLAATDDGALRPTLAVMRAAATIAAGARDAAASLLADARARQPGRTVVGGRPIDLSTTDAGALAAILEATCGPPASASGWRQPRGDAARNAVVTASRPLLVPRFRVPLTRHPEETKQLDAGRRAALEEGRACMPAGNVVALGDTVVLRSPLGILGVDFRTGKRLWVRSDGADLPGGDVPETARAANLQRVFDDATTGGLSSDGRLVFAVEGRRQPSVPGVGFVAPGEPQAGGNALVAFDLTGVERWRAPATAPDASSWYLGAPLVVGAEAYVLVEEAGRIRLDVLATATGTVLWSQPLADLEDEPSASMPSGARRLAGLTPALADGVLVCPIGGGTVVALDVAGRTLLWAHAYPVTSGPAFLATNRPRGALDPPPERPSQRCEPCPVIAAGRVLLTPADSDLLICLTLRDGKPAWPAALPGSLQLAGIVDHRALVVARDGVEAVDLDTGLRVWRTAFDEGSTPCGRGILTATSLLVPLDSPEVLDIRLDDGVIVGRCAARGGIAPGNLVAHRGEIISLGVESLDVFHQSAALDTDIQTAAREGRPAGWADHWRGQLALERGDVAEGLDLIREATVTAAGRIPARARADALAFGLARDFPAAAPRWRAWAAAGDAAAAAPDVVRLALDGFLAADDFAAAWEVCRGLLELPAAPPDLVRDSTDPDVHVTADRWLRGRFHELATRAPAAVRDAIATGAAQAVARAAARTDPRDRIATFERLMERLGDHPAGETARAGFVSAVDELLGAGDTVPRAVEIRRDLARRTLDQGGSAAEADGAAAWPLGRVECRWSGRQPETPGDTGLRGGLVPVPLAGERLPRIPGLTLAYDPQLRRLVASDAFGRTLGEPLPVVSEGGLDAIPWLNQASLIRPRVIDRLLVVHGAGGVVAFDMHAPAGHDRLVWRRPGRPERIRATTLQVRWNAALAREGCDGTTPLGRGLLDPLEAEGSSATRGGVAGCEGILVPAGRSLTLLDPVSGRPLWERHRLPMGADWIGDDAFACGCTADGRGSPVVSLADGRLVHLADVPPRRQRIAVHGRRIVAVTPLDDALEAGRVRLDLLDPVDLEPRGLGEFSGTARAAHAGGGRVVVLEADGACTLVDPATGGVAFRCRLPAMPGRFEQLRVVEGREHLYVVAAAPAPADGDDDVSPVRQLLAAGESAQPSSGAIWALGLRDGRPAWPVPATFERHYLHAAQPVGLPVLLLCSVSPAGPDRDLPGLGLLCLDKRTGHAILAGERLETVGPGCQLVGLPEESSIIIGDGRGTAARVTLRFTGEPMAPRPPHQARGGIPPIRRGLGGFGIVPQTAGSSEADR